MSRAAGRALVTLRVAVEIEPWAQEYGMDPAAPAAIRADVESYLRMLVQESSAGQAALITIREEGA